MAEFTNAQLKTTLNTWLRDSQDKTFTQDEKTEFLTSAIDDSLVYKVTIDTSISTTAVTPTYEIPDGIDEVLSVGVDVLGNGYPQWLDSNNWDEVDGTLYISMYEKDMPAGKTVYIKGKTKLAPTDSIPGYLREYVLHLAMVYAYETLIASFTTRFLKNDVTMSEIVNAINVQRSRVQELRKGLRNKYEVSR